MSVSELGITQRYRLSAAPLLYDEVGHTALDLPAGYRHVRRRAVLGHGRALFDEVAAEVLAWQIQSRSGIAVRASDPTARLGSVVQLGIGYGRLFLSAPCRVVYVVDEPLHQGFAYGTLPGHPESGEEAFVADFEPATDEVVLRVTAFSRPANLLTRLGGPVAHLGQDLMTNRYMRALAR